MDSMRFDTLSRTISGVSSRRQALRTVATLGLGLGLARVGLAVSPAEAAKKGKKKALGERCSNKDTCSSGLKCKKANSQNSCYAETEKRCCKPIGARCNDGCECCGVDVICNGGYCQGA